MASVSSILAVGSTLAGMLFGGQPAPTIAGIQLTGLATPEKMNFGGGQRLAVHKLPGGARVIDAMGADDSNIEFSGYLTGYGAAAMARQLDAIRIAGAVVPLTWPGFTRQVVVSQFTCDYRQAGFILPYRITCVVLPGTVATAAKPSLLSSIASDVQSAIASVTAFAAPVLAVASTALSAVQAVLPVAGVLTGGSAAFLSVAGAVSGASGAIGAATALADGSMGAAAASAAGLIGGASGAGALSAFTSGSAAASALMTATTQAGNLANGLAVQGYVSRMSANLTAAL